MSLQSSLISVTGPSFLITAALTGLLGSTFVALSSLDVRAQLPQPPITSSGLGTQISAPITTPGEQIQYNITGGTRSSGGVNLFHSFGNFNVPSDNVVNFLNESPSLQTSNILGRVTGGNISNIFGTIQTTDFPGADLFLMNSAGFLFGPNAALNVGGTVTFTSADYLRLTDGGRFNASTTSAAPDLLTAAPVTAFGFLGSSPSAITIQGSQLTVSPGSGISLVGGDIGIEAAQLGSGTLQPAHLTARGGQINLVSVAGRGEVQVPHFEPASSMAMGSINLSQDTVVNVSANSGGTVRIRSGSLVMDTALISADTMAANAAPLAIDMNVTGNVSISAIDAPALAARTVGAGNAGGIRISSGSMDVTATAITTFFSTSTIDTHTSGSGKAGGVNIFTGDLTVVGGFVNFIDSGTSGVNPGRGGDVTISAHDIQAKDATITTGNFAASFLDGGGAGTAGNVTIIADSLQMSGTSQIVTDSADFVTQVGTGGDITVTAPNINLDATSFSSAGWDHGGSVTISAEELFANRSIIATQTIDGAGGPIAVTGKTIELKNGSSFVSSTGGDGHAGSVSVAATDHLSLLQSLKSGRPSGIFTSSFGDFETAGDAGDILITTPRLEMTGGARIDSSTATSGRGGNAIIQTSDSFSILGETEGQPIEPLFNLGSVQSSGIYTRTIGGSCNGLCGNAGNVSITTGSLLLGTGSQINSGTSSSGQGGTITINAASSISMSGTLSTGQPGGIQNRTIGTSPDSGPGGKISLTAGQSVTIRDGASVSASSTGPANAGNIEINAGQQLVMQNGSVKTEAAQAGGGNIDIQAVDMIRLGNSNVSTSVLGGAGSGGNIKIDPKVVVLQNSNILAQAVRGKGGDITITTPLLLSDSLSLIDASTPFGLNGIVRIQSPYAPSSGKIQPLGNRPLQVASLLNQRCAALAGGRVQQFHGCGQGQSADRTGRLALKPIGFRNDLRPHDPMAIR